MNSAKQFIDILNRQLEKKGYENYTISEIEECEPDIDGDGNPFYEKQRLHYIFSGRLKGSLLHDKENPYIEFLKDAIESLENVPDEEKIFSWGIVIDGKRISGRSTCDRILHVYPPNF